MFNQSTNFTQSKLSIQKLMPATRHYFTVYANQRGKVLKYSTVVKETLEDGMHLGCFEFGMRYDFHTCMFSIL